MENWLLKTDPKLSGKENMAIDAELLRKAVKPDFTPVLRFFDWERPTITIGYCQKRSDLDFDRMGEKAIDFAVRPTGGRAVLHWNEFTYSITIPAGHPICEMSVLDSYRLISSAFVAGFEMLGIGAELARGEAGGNRQSSCFSSTSRYEVVVGGKKLVGSAQRRKNGAILQQGSIPIGPEYLELDKFLKKSKKTSSENKSTYIAECIDTVPERIDFIHAITRGFEEELKIRFNG